MYLQKKIATIITLEIESKASTHDGTPAVCTFHLHTIRFGKDPAIMEDY